MDGGEDGSLETMFTFTQYPKDNMASGESCLKEHS